MAWDEFLGGHDFDSRIAKLMGEQFDEAHSKNMDGVSVFDSPRAMARLLKEAERYKVVLSSNKETPMTVEARGRSSCRARMPSCTRIGIRQFRVASIRSPPRLVFSE